MSESKAVSLYDQSRLFSAPLPEGGAVCRSEGMTVESDDHQQSGDLNISIKDAVPLFVSVVFLISSAILSSFSNRYLSPGFDFAFFLSAVFFSILGLIQFAMLLDKMGQEEGPLTKFAMLLEKLDQEETPKPE